MIIYIGWFYQHLSSDFQFYIYTVYIKFDVAPESQSFKELRVIKSYARNPNELRYARTGNNIRCYPAHPADIRPLH